MKYARLSETTCTSECSSPVNPAPEQYLFKLFTSGHDVEYQAYFPLDRMFGVTSIGIKTARDHLVLDFDRAAVEQRMNALRDPRNGTKELRERFHITDNTQWCFDDARREFQRTFNNRHFSPVEARPFDARWLYFHRSVVFNTRPTVNKHVHQKENLCLLAMRRIRTERHAHFFVANRIGMGEILSSADNCNFFPLYLYHEDMLPSRSSRSTNFTPELLNQVAQWLDIRIDEISPRGLAPEDIFHYVYAVLHSLGYRSRYAEFLKIDFPRLPLTGNFELFRTLARLGGELVAVHLMESPKLDQHITWFVGSGRPEVEKVTHANETVWIDKAQTCGFTGVPEDVWNFHIGGYQVCEKWLKDRKGRVLSKEDIEHYHRIVVALHETIRLMAEIDEVIEEHGGWPVAFVTDREALTFGSAEPAIQTTEPKAVSSAQGEVVPYAELEEDSTDMPLAKVAELSDSAPIPESYRSASADKAREAPSSIGETMREESIAIIRDVFEIPANSSGLDRETAIHQIAQAMGLERVGPHIREVIEGDLISALRRRVICNDRNILRLDCRSIHDYSRDELKKHLLSAMGITWWDQDEAIRVTARYLGFRRTGSAIQEAFKSAINGAIRQARLEREGGRIRALR